MNDFVLETEFAALTIALASFEEDFSDKGHIIGDCKDYMLAFTSLNVHHIYHEINI